MAGLGDNLSSLGQSLFAHGLSIHKANMLEELEKDREKRADDRLKAKEDRQQKREDGLVKEWKKTQLADGRWIEEGLNSSGAKITERAMDPSAIDDINFSRDKNRLTLDGLLTDNKLGEKKLNSFDEDKSLARRLVQAQIGSENRQYTGSNTRPAEYSSPSTDSLAALFGNDDEITGKRVIDQTRLRDFQTWRAEHPEIRDGDEALVAYQGYLNSRESQGALLDEMKADGIPAYLRDKARSQMESGEPVNVSAIPMSSLSKEQQAKAQRGMAAIQRARAAIRKGKITREEAIRQLRKEGYHKLAMEL